MAKHTTFKEVPIGHFFLDGVRNGLSEKELPYKKTGQFEFNSPACGLVSCGENWPVTYVGVLVVQEEPSL